MCSVVNWSKFEEITRRKCWVHPYFNQRGEIDRAEVTELELDREDLDYFKQDNTRKSQILPSLE
jgi:hypothetical protein